MKNVYLSKNISGNEILENNVNEYLPSESIRGLIMATCCPLFFMAAMQAQAQSVINSPPADKYMEEVVATGTASNYKNSVLGKRSAEGIVDMLDTDELGRLPDKNIGETLNRIPGISMLLEKG